MAEEIASDGGREAMASAAAPEGAGSTRRLAILLAMAVFVLVVDESDAAAGVMVQLAAVRSRFAGRAA
jgi:hypothetical protein